MSMDLVGCAGVTTSSFALGADSAAHGVTETTIWSSGELPYGSIGYTGANVNLEYAGIASATAIPPTLTLRVTVDAVNVCVMQAAAPPANASNLGWHGKALLTTRATDSIYGQAWLHYPATPGGAHSGTTAAQSITLGATPTVAITGQWGATTAGNTFTLTHAVLNIDGISYT